VKLITVKLPTSKSDLLDILESVGTAVGRRVRKAREGTGTAIINGSEYTGKAIIHYGYALGKAVDGSYAKPVQPSTQPCEA
jgi:hypothetical protein